MATSANLPAGFSITTISGVRCTAVPKTATTLSGGAQTDVAKSTTKTEATSTSIKESTTQTPPPPATTSTTAAAVVNTPAPAISSTSIAVPATSEQASSSPVSSTIAPPAVVATTQPPLAATTTPPVVVSSTFSTAISESPKSSAPGITATALPITTPASPASSSTISPSTSILPVALSDTLPSSSAAAAASSSFRLTAGGSHTDSSHSDGSSHHSSTAAAAAAAPSSLSGGTESSASSLSGSGSSGKAVQVGPIVGGVVGGLAGIALIAFLLLFFLRQRKKNRRSTLLTPLGTGRDSRFYEIDQRSVGPTKRGEKWRVGAGLQVEKMGGIVSGLKETITSLKTRVVGPRSDTPSVNLNRGQSQFLDGPIPQHSRSNSTASGSIGRITVKDRFGDWVERFRERLRGTPKEPEDPYATARGMSEKQANMNGNPDFSQLLNMDDRELHLKAEQRRASLTAKSYQPGGGLGSLDFGNSLDPFADPTNPFADPVTQPKPSVSKQNNYIADVRRSRGLSTDMTNQASGTGIGTGAGGWRPPSSVPASRYPSTIAPSRDSYRDTVYSTFSSNVRKGKGRSDPFDLERPELWRSPPPMPEAPISAAETESMMAGMERGSAVPPPLALSQSARVVSTTPPRHESTGTYASKYSSGISLGGFGDPGPDVGPGSGASSLRENGLYNYANDLGRSSSVASSISSKGGVGKAR